jgi:acetyl-CoA decarbonylase/synthase, CODH/ACS complex subunit gamma
MALTGLKIQKLLPRTNCKECGSNTCLAFAMKLAAKKVELSACPYASDEAKRVLGAAAEPPVRGVKLGPSGALKLGEETVLYRHERSFVSPTAIAVDIDETMPEATLEATLVAIRDYAIDRVGDDYCVDMVSVTQRGDRAEAFVALAKRAWEACGKPLVLRSDDPQALTRAAIAVKGSGSVIAGVTEEHADSLWPVAQQSGHAIAITAPQLDALVALSTRLRDAGCKGLVMELPALSLAERFQLASIARRSALEGGVKPLGLPHLAFVEGDDLLDLAVTATTEICKYGGIVVLPRFDAALLAALLTLRLNIFTDPQKPIQVEPGLYPIVDPGPDSPVFVTTNFSLTYFLVSGELENSGISAWLLVPECEGMSVLTAWAAGKFSGAHIARFAKSIELEGKVQDRRMVIPGLVAQISGELEESMPGWGVLVGPQQAADLEAFIKARFG